MNVAVVVRSLRIGGMERVAANLSDAFANSGHDVSLIYLKDKPVQIKPENNNIQIRLINLDKLLVKTGIGLIWIVISAFLNMIFRKSLFIWKGLVQSGIFLKELKKIEKVNGKFDIIIVRGQGTFEILWKIQDSRFINVCENIFTKERLNVLDRIYTKVLFNNKNFVCVSHGVFKNFFEYMDLAGVKPCKVKVITNPIDIDLIRKKAEISLPEIPHKKYLLGLGRLVRQKNFSLLIKSYKKLIDDYGVKEILVIVGDGKEKNMLKALTTDLGLEDRVLFFGFTDNPYAWMARSELFILSSNFEGLGMVIIEALAAGTNVVATDSPGGVRDIMWADCLKNNLSKMDEGNLAEKINSNMGVKLPFEEIEAVLEKFKPENIVKDYITFKR